MLRRTPLRRKARLRAHSKTSKHSRRERDWPYLAFVHTLPCAARLLTSTGYECDGPIEADHIGGRYGEDSDKRCIPLCRKHHRQRTGVVGGGGLWAGWSLERKREWGWEAVAATLAAWEGR
jgi:hypothetical protein